MQVNLYFTYASKNEEVKKQVCEVFAGAGIDAEVQPERVFAEKTFSYAGDESVDDYCIRAAIDEGRKLGAVLHGDYELTGVIDTSYTAGECMDFSLCFGGGDVSVKVSDWYIEEWTDRFESYEEFSEEYPGHSEEEFNRLKESEFVYAFADENGEYSVFSKDVPLHEYH